MYRSSVPMDFIPFGFTIRQLRSVANHIGIRASMMEPEGEGFAINGNVLYFLGSLSEVEAWFAERQIEPLQASTLTTEAGTLVAARLTASEIWRLANA